MQVQIYKALWGMTGSLASMFERVATAGYDGVEAWPQNQFDDATLFLQLAEQHNLNVIIAGFIDDKADVQSLLQQFASFNPTRINLHPGRDAMTFDEGCAFFEECLNVADSLDMPVLHETHRGRLTYDPWTTAAYLRQFPELRITADYSHWVNVCGRLPNDVMADIELANQRAGHIHARVGYEHGPQVPDPSAPEYAPHLEWHEAQWKKIYDLHVAAGAELLTFDPEYGPPSYMHTLPHTNVPVADLWEVCLWSANRARELFGMLKPV